MSEWLVINPKTCVCVDQKHACVKTMQLNHNAYLYSAVSMNSGQHIHVSGMLPLPQQGGNQSNFGGVALANSPELNMNNICCGAAFISQEH